MSNVPRQYGPTLVSVWVGFEFAGGQIGVPILLATVLLSDIRRRRLPTLINLLVTWVVASFACCLLWYTNHDLPGDKQPSYSLCLLQASFVYAVPPMTALSACALVYEGWVTVSGKAPIATRQRTCIRTLVLMLIPWAGWLGSAIATFAVGYADPSAVSRTRRVFYCSVRNDPLTNTLAVVVAITLFVSLFFAARIAHLLWIDWVGVKRRALEEELESGQPTINPSGRREAPASPYTAIRIAIFGTYVFLALALSFASIVAPRSPVPDLVSSTIPCVETFLVVWPITYRGCSSCGMTIHRFAVFIIFGTQADIIRIWLHLVPSMLLPRRVREWTRCGGPSPEQDIVSTHVGSIPQIRTQNGNDIEGVLSREQFLDLESARTVKRMFDAEKESQRSASKTNAAANPSQMGQKARGSLSKPLPMVPE